MAEELVRVGLKSLAFSKSRKILCEKDWHLFIYLFLRLVDVKRWLVGFECLALRLLDHYANRHQRFRDCARLHCVNWSTLRVVFFLDEKKSNEMQHSKA